MIDIKDLGFSYGKYPVLSHITMNLQPGRIYGLLGENGVGKTTLLTILSGLKTPQVGAVTIDGFNPFRKDPHFLESMIYLPDEVMPYNMKAIDFARSCGQFRPNYEESLFLQIMNEFEVDTEKKMNRMSAGQLKKTYISFAFASKVQYLFLDEPTNGLDIPSKAQFRKALMKYTPDDSTIIISTHQVRDLENVIDPIIILDRQEVLLNASMEEIASKLYFDYGTTLHPESLYSEQLPGGFIQVLVNSTGEESKIGIEALFNAVSRNKDLIRNLFKK